MAQGQCGLGGKGLYVVPGWLDVCDFLDRHIWSASWRRHGLPDVLCTPWRRCLEDRDGGLSLGLGMGLSDLGLGLGLKDLVLGLGLMDPDLGLCLMDRDPIGSPFLLYLLFPFQSGNVNGGLGEFALCGDPEVRVLLLALESCGHFAAEVRVAQVGQFAVCL
jgi:hypothetical protein